ncbi:unnamed protein product [Rhizophagus irregularis]|nr:unnamed protein product [Rhizophagus irregularis]CAB5363598.1 unnamed protein product [Rhizophagus irregularis]
MHWVIGYQGPAESSISKGSTMHELMLTLQVTNTIAQAVTNICTIIAKVEILESCHRVKLSAYKNALNALYPNSSYLSMLTRSLKMKAERRFRKRRSGSRNWRKRIGKTGGRRKQLFTNNIVNFRISHYNRF